MPKRKDHAAAARGILRIVGRDQLMDDSARITSMLAAVTHATLALAEQQWVANRIALSQATEPNGQRVYPGALTHPADEYSTRVNDEIREALGLS